MLNLTFENLRRKTSTPFAAMWAAPEKGCSPGWVTYASFVDSMNRSPRLRLNKLGVLVMVENGRDEVSQ